MFGTLNRTRTLVVSYGDVGRVDALSALAAGGVIVRHVGCRGGRLPEVGGVLEQIQRRLRVGSGGDERIVLTGLLEEDSLSISLDSRMGIVYSRTRKPSLHSAYSCTKFCQFDTRISLLLKSNGEKRQILQLYNPI